MFEQKEGPMFYFAKPSLLRGWLYATRRRAIDAFYILPL